MEINTKKLSPRDTNTLSPHLAIVLVEEDASKNKKPFFFPKELFWLTRARESGDSKNPELEHNAVTDRVIPGQKSNPAVGEQATRALGK